MNITITYATDGSSIVKSINSEISKSKSDWDICEYPLFKNDGNNFFRRIKDFEIKTDVVIFVCTKKYIKENSEYFKLLQNANKNRKYRFFWIFSDAQSKKVIENAPIDIEIFLNSDLQIDMNDFINYLSITELSVKRYKEKQQKSRKQFNAILMLMMIYAVIIFCAVSVLYFGDSDYYKSSAEFMLIALSFITALCFVFSVFFSIDKYKRKKEQKEKIEFNKDLDMSLSNSKNSTKTVKATNLLLEILEREYTNKKFLNPFSDFLPIDIIDSVLQLFPNSDKNTNNTYDAVDSEISNAMGEEEYLPLGHLKFNWKQMKGYYDISKKQATTSFRWAIAICFLGIAIIIFAIISPIFPVFSTQNSLIPVIGSIGGAIVEIFAGTILLVYKKSLSQMNLYHKALSEYQRYLSCINLVTKISNVEKQDILIEEIIREEIKKTDVSLDKDFINFVKSKQNKNN